MALLTDELRSWVGREAHYPGREALGRASIRYFALALDDDNPLYLDEVSAREAGHADIVAPPTLICESCQYAHQRPDADGYIGHDWHLPLPHCRMIRAANDYQFMRPVLASDVISVTWTLESLTEKPSSRGGSQLFVQSVARYTDARGELVAVNRETMVFQPVNPDAASDA